MFLLIFILFLMLTNMHFLFRRVLEWQEPEQLRRLIDFEVNEKPASQDHLLELMEDVIRYSVKTGHPRFVNQLFSR
jgi:hypothetical protein